jgi:hypothetical protein
MEDLRNLISKCELVDCYQTFWIFNLQGPPRSSAVTWWVCYTHVNIPYHRKSSSAQHQGFQVIDAWWFF